MACQRKCAPNRVFVEVNINCPHTCAHCYQVQHGRDRKRSLSIADAINRVRQLKQLGIPNIIPVTGEILGYPEYLDVYREAGWTEYLVSNGLLIVGNEKLGQTVASYGFKLLCISAHYECPKNLGGNRLGISPFPLKMVPKIVAAAARHNMGVEAFCVIGAFNYNRIEQIFGRAINDGLESLWLMNLMPTNEFIQKFCLTNEQIQSVFRQVETIRSHNPKYRNRIFLEGNFGPRTGSKNGLSLAKKGCYCPAGIDQIYITIDGNIYGCHFMLKPGMEIGRFEDGQFVMKGDIPGIDRSNCYFVQNR